jgi:hypothetical protein
MGLDTTHDCWHGPYSQFMRWRQWINHFVMEERGNAGDEAARKIARMGATPAAIEKAWNDGHYEDQSVPINVLMAHSDCDGDIPADVCGRLADALEALLDKHMPQRGIYDEQRPATERFIRGLRKAAAAGEAVIFH